MDPRLIEILGYLTTTAGAGVAASYLFAWLRRVVSFPDQRPDTAWQCTLWRILYKALWSDAWTLWTAPFLALLIGTGASLFLALVQGDDLWYVFWAFASAWISQQWYRHGKMQHSELEWPDIQEDEP
jgi:hypothetical protein